MSDKSHSENTYREVNFDGLIGPTHNYAGLSHGNLASSKNAQNTSQPKEAALQCLNKMKFLQSLGLTQGVFIPQQRPHIPTLRSLGFSGSDQQVIEKAWKAQPELLTACYSASSMWAANAATVSPSPDTSDNRVHFTPANLSSMLHRSIEHETTGKMLQTIFANTDHFCHHSALHSSPQFGDEGAANHGRFCEQHSDEGVELFVYGAKRMSGRSGKPTASTSFPARQSLEASQAVARLHGLNENKRVFVQQNPEVIDAGVFHNDVVSVANGNVLFTHELAFASMSDAQAQLQAAYGDNALHFIEVPSDAVPLQDAVISYLFNSQLLSLPSGDMALVLPVESEENAAVAGYLEQLLTLDTPIKHVKFINVRQSMRNGGGPACLRLRVVLSDEELAAMHSQFLLTDELHQQLSTWVNTHYRDELSPEDLADPSLLTECYTALDELTQIFNIGSFYEFQQL